MTIENAIKSYCKSCPNIGFIIPTDTEGYWNINVLFINPDGMEDETQFDILPAYFDYGIGKCPELAQILLTMVSDYLECSSKILKKRRRTHGSKI